MLEGKANSKRWEDAPPGYGELGGAESFRRRPELADYSQPFCSLRLRSTSSFTEVESTLMIASGA